MVCIARFEQPYYADPIKTAADAVKAAYKTVRWRRAHLAKPTAPKQPEHPKIVPIATPKPPEPEAPNWDWFYIPPADRSDKFPVGFVSHIKSLVCNEFKVSLSSLQLDLRSVYIVIPRHIAIYLTKMLTNESSTKIGHRFDRDHSSILHALVVLPQKMRKDGNLCQQVAELQIQLEQDLAKWRAST